MIEKTVSQQDEELLRHAIEQALGPKPTPGQIRDVANLLLSLADELEQRATAVDQELNPEPPLVFPPAP